MPGGLAVVQQMASSENRQAIPVDLIAGSFHLQNGRYTAPKDADGARPSSGALRFMEKRVIFYMWNQL
jgi:hypothetical protein